MIFDSWDIVDGNTAIKQSDKSFFKYHGSGIPKETRFYWGVEDLSVSEKRNIQLVFEDKEYSAYIQLEQMGKRTRIFWRMDLHNKFLEQCPDVNYMELNNLYPAVLFKKIEVDKYEVQLIIESFEALEQNDYEAYESRPEGQIKVFYTKRYERDPKNRAKAIQLHGTACIICGFDFEKVYGKEGKGIIDIHHNKPLYSLNEEVIVNPKTDLVPVCPNCHRMIHRTRKAACTVEEIKSMLKGNI